MTWMCDLLAMMNKVVRMWWVLSISLAFGQHGVVTAQTGTVETTNQQAFLKMRITDRFPRQLESAIFAPIDLPVQN